MKIRFCFLLFVLVTHLINSQSFVGYETDNNNGIHGVMANPAYLAQPRSFAEVNFLSFSGTLANDLALVGVADVVRVLQGEYEVTPLNSGPSNANTIIENSEVVGPSIMLSLKGGKYRNSGINAVALFTKLRRVRNYNNVNGNLLLSLTNSFPEDDYSIDQGEFDSATHTWGELGLSYARSFEFWNEKHEQRFLKAGASVKWLRGRGVELGNSNSIFGAYSAANGQLNLNGDYANIDYGEQGTLLNDVLSQSGQGFGFDFGLALEVRTRETERENRRQRRRDVHENSINGYLLKAGVSVLDVGRITYKDARLNDYFLNGPVSTEDLENADNFKNVLDATYPKDTINGDLKVGLPTRLRGEVDVKILDNFYANLTGNISLLKANNLFDNNILNSATLTARYETRRISAYFPVTFSKYGSIELTENIGLDMGLGINVYGIFHIGSGSILSELLSSQDATASTANFYLGIKLPISWNWLDEYYDSMPEFVR